MNKYRQQAARASIREIEEEEAPELEEIPEIDVLEDEEVPALPHRGLGVEQTLDEARKAAVRGKRTGAL